MPTKFNAFPYAGPPGLWGAPRNAWCRTEAGAADLRGPKAFLSYKKTCTRKCPKTQVRTKTGHCTTIGPKKLTKWQRHIKAVARANKGSGMSAPQLAKLASKSYRR